MGIHLQAHGEILTSGRALRNSIVNVVIGNGVLFIGNSAFSSGSHWRYANGNSNQITSLTLGNSIKYIDDFAFCDHRISTLIIPESVVHIGSKAFLSYNRNSLTSITIGKYVILTSGDDESFYYNSNYVTFYINNKSRAGRYTFSNGKWNYTP